MHELERSRLVLCSSEVQIVLGREDVSYVLAGSTLLFKFTFITRYPSCVIDHGVISKVNSIVTSDTRTVPSGKPEMMCWLSGENATDLAESVCPVRGPAPVSPVMAFHTRFVRSSEPETMCWPSGGNATDQTESVPSKTTFEREGDAAGVREDRQLGIECVPV
jgi:hypothetical protein